MHNDYFQKWCCLLIIDDPSISGSGISTVISPEVQSFIHASYCNCYIYSNTITADFATVISLNEIQGNLIEHAFRSAFESGFRKVILIDATAAIHPKWLEEAFLSLKMIEFCIGPKSEGCYLFGMNSFEKDFFNEMPAVLLTDKKALIRKIGKTHLALYKTPLLADVSLSGF